MTFMKEGQGSANLFSPATHFTAFACLFSQKPAISSPKDIMVDSGQEAAPTEGIELTDTIVSSATTTSTTTSSASTPSPAATTSPSSSPPPPPPSPRLHARAWRSTVSGVSTCWAFLRSHPKTTIVTVVTSVVGIVLTSWALALAYRAQMTADWTARKDWIEFCKGQRVSFSSETLPWLSLSLSLLTLGTI